MFKRTKGYVLLTLLVVTGLGSQVSNETLSSKERKYQIQHLKETRSAFLNSVKGLSEAQLNYKASADKWSIKECIYHIALSEKTMLGMLEQTMNQPATPEKRSEIKVQDDQLIGFMQDRTTKFQAPEMIRPEKAPWKSEEEAIASFKESRKSFLRYVKTTTDDVRNHMVTFPFGTLDVYQLILSAWGHSSRHTAQINEVKKDPGFPK
jgi:hypothetical protein